MFKELTLQNIWESEMPVENGSTSKFKSTLWWPTLVEGLKPISTQVIHSKKMLKTLNFYKKRSIIKKNNAFKLVLARVVLP